MTISLSIKEETERINVHILYKELKKQQSLSVHTWTKLGTQMSLRFKPISTLTGGDDEWDECSRDGVFQNKRCSSVFKKKDGTFEDIDGIIVSDNGGITWFSSGRFRKNITFPYLPPVHPEKVYIEYLKDVPPGFTGDDYEVITDKPERIKELYGRKRKEFDGVKTDN